MNLQLQFLSLKDALLRDAHRSYTWEMNSAQELTFYQNQGTVVYTSNGVQLARTAQNQTDYFELQEAQFSSYNTNATASNCKRKYLLLEFGAQEVLKIQVAQIMDYPTK